MKNGVLAFSLFLSAGVIGLAGFAGCSSSDDAPPAEETDAGAETAVDTGTPKVDTGTPETPDLACPTMALPTGYECPAAPVKPVSNKCTDVAIQAIYNGCFGGIADECNKAQTMYKDCFQCMLSDWLVPTFDMNSGYIDVGACMQKIDPASPCGAAENCWYDCRETACENCDTSDPATSSSVRNKCYANVRKTGTGICYDKAYKQAKACETDPKFAACVNAIQLFRGACRDNGDWSKADIDLTPDGGTMDGGSDGATDSGSDTSVTDSGSADSGSADSGSADSGSADSGSADSGAADSGLLPDVGLDVLGD